MDNIALTERLQELRQSLAVHAPQSALKLRAITDQLTWVFCFSGYMAAATDCPSTRNMAAYAQIVIQQSRKHPGMGWIAYDQFFCQQQASSMDLPWNDLAPSIMAATVLRSGECCTLCHSSDHSTEQCAWSPFAKGSPPPPPRSTEKPPGSQGQNRNHRFRPYSALPTPPSTGSEEVFRRFNNGSCPYTHSCLLCNSTLHGCSWCPEKRDDGKVKGRQATPASTINKANTTS